MATDTAGDSGQIFYTNQTHYLLKKVLYSDFGTTSGDNVVQTVGWLPPGAVVVRGSTWIKTAFNDTNGDDLDIGVEGSDDDLFASAVDANTGSVLTAFDDLADANRYSASARKVTVNLTTAASGDGTTGEAWIFLEYFPAPTR